MKYCLFIVFIISLFSCQSIPEKIEYTSIEIIRDDFGVPHIYAPTDAETAYGLAWAQCEDDFETMQEQMLAGRGLYGEVKGQDGAIVDFAIKFMGIKEIAYRQYPNLPNDVKKLLQGYVDGVNAYAAHHPERLMHKDLFPLVGEDLAVGTLLGLINLTNAGRDLQKVLSDHPLKALTASAPTGSNGIAISKKINPENETLLAINSHQPMEGWYSWYEAHLVSEEGLNILGGTFAGGATIFHGVNEYLGWAHTVNHPDLSDVYQLTMHETEPLQYEYDGQWLTLEEKKYKSWVKLWWIIKIPVTRTVYESVYGPTFKTDDGFFAWRSVAAQDIRAITQWYRMNKAKSYEEYMKALSMQGLPSMNIVYADREDNIYYLSNSRVPRRNEAYNWQGILPGNTSATLWSPNEYFTIDYLPQVLNPESGYVYNTNNSPFNSAGACCNPKEPAINNVMSYQPPGYDNNRSRRLAGLLAEVDSIDYLKFKEIKFDRTYPEYLGSRQIKNLELIMELDPVQYPDLKIAIEKIRSWNRETELDNETAPLFILIANNITEKLRNEMRLGRATVINEGDVIYGYTKAIEHLQKYFGKLDVAMKDFQVHQRGEVEIPIPGGPDVLGAMYGAPMEDGRHRVFVGESYIMMIRFTADGPVVETVNAYGSNANIGDPHSTSQMKLFAEQQLKPMTLDMKIIRSAYGEAMYHPLKIQK